MRIIRLACFLSLLLVLAGAIMPHPAAAADDDSGWFVILGSFQKADLTAAESRMGSLNNSGLDAYIIDTNEYGNLKDGLWAVVMGPYSSESGAQQALEQARSQVSDAYVKNGGAKTQTHFGATVEPEAKWFIIAGSFQEGGQVEAENRLEKVRDAGFRAYIVSTDQYPNFSNGLLAVVIGPFDYQKEAEEVNTRVRQTIPDAYVKAAW